MGAFIDVEQVSKRYRNQRVLSNVTLRLGPRQKGALVGANGVGKSTLLRLIAGLERPNAGAVNMPSGALVGYLPQEVAIRGDETVEGYLRRVTGIDDVQRRLDELAASLGSGRGLAEYADLQARFECLGGWDFERRVQIVLAGFGLRAEDAGRPLHTLSGGQARKVALGGVLLQGVDVLLLDEPASNLDLPALLWLESFLRESSATILMVSHDRRLIDRVASKVFELDWQTREATTYGGGFGDFLALKAQELRRQKELYRRQQEEIGRLSDSMRQSRQWAEAGAVQQGADHDKMGRDFSRERSARLGRRGRSIEKRLEQMDLVDKPAERPRLDLRIGRPPEAAEEGVPVAQAPAAAELGVGLGRAPEADQQAGAPGIRLVGVRAGFPGGFSLGPVDVELRAGMRAAIVGVNGAGKSTLLRTITGQLPPLAGSVAVDASVVFGNLVQAQDDLPRSANPLWFLQTRAGLAEDAARELLQAFQLRPADIHKTIGELSPGMRTRLLLAWFSAIGANALVLDEPTNHLDLEAIQALEEALDGYRGIVLVVSHDREFLSRLQPSDCWLLQDGRLAAIPSFDAYVADVQVRASKLLTRL